MPDSQKTSSDSAVRLVRQVVDVLRSERERQGISQNELAQRCDISRTGLRAIELGINSPTFASLVRISRALGMSLGEIVTRLEKERE